MMNKLISIAEAINRFTSAHPLLNGLVWAAMFAFWWFVLHRYANQQVEKRRRKLPKPKPVVVWRSK